MDGTHQIQPLTEENLRVYQDERPISPSITSTDCLPIDRLERAKRCVYNFLKNLKRIDDEGEQIRNMVDVYISGELEVGYRGNDSPQPDLRDPSFWEAKFESLNQEHALTVEVTRIKHSVCELMRTIRNCGREGREFLADYELHIFSRYDVRYRGNSDPKPDMNDPAYWNAQRELLCAKYKSLSDANFKRRFPDYRLPSPVMRAILESKPVSRANDPVLDQIRKKDGIEVWRHRNYVEPIISEPRSPVFSDSPEGTTTGSVEGSNGNRPELTRSFRWGEAYRGVYKRMTALWHLGGEGRELVENDELCVAGKYDVRYRRSRGPKPDLKDPSYWEAKWQYFTEKYVSLLRGMEDNTQLLEELTLDSWEIPVPDPASYNSSTTASLVEPLNPSPESFWANTMKLLKLSLYKVMSRDFFKNEGRQILENDELYIAGRYDVRYRHKGGPEPDLKDPFYWRAKLLYFRDCYFSSLTVEEIADMPPMLGMVNLSTISSDESDDSYQDEIPTLLPPPIWRPPVSQNDRTPCSAAAATQPTELPEGPKRKRVECMDNAQQDADPIQRPEKRRKTGTGRASEVLVTSIERSPIAAPSPSALIGDVVLQQSRVSDATLDRRASQLSAAPEDAEEPKSRDMQAPPQRRKRQRKTYEKERSSRRLAGQSPEWGELPKRGEKPQPYHKSSRPARNTSGSGPRNSRAQTKPAKAKDAKSRAISRPAEGESGSRKRPKRR